MKKKSPMKEKNCVCVQEWRRFLSYITTQLRCVDIVKLLLGNFVKIYNSVWFIAFYFMVIRL